MTSPLPIIVDSEDRGMKRPVEEVARAMFCEAEDYLADEAMIKWDDPTMTSPRLQAVFRSYARAVLDRLVQLGFLNDNYFVAKKAEEAGK